MKRIDGLSLDYKQKGVKFINQKRTKVSKGKQLNRKNQDCVT